MAMHQGPSSAGDAAPPDLMYPGRVCAPAVTALQLRWARRKDRSIMAQLLKCLQGFLLWVWQWRKRLEGLAFCCTKGKIWNPRREKQALLWDKMLAGKCNYFFLFSFLRANGLPWKHGSVTALLAPAETSELTGDSVGHWRWYSADCTPKAISRTADSCRMATDGSQSFLLLIKQS